MQRFDSRFFMYMEDTDLSYRLHLHKHQNLFVPQAGAIHEWGKGAEGGKIARAWHHHQSVWKYFLKHFQANGFSLIVLPAILIGQFPAGLSASAEEEVADAAQLAIIIAVVSFLLGLVLIHR